VSFEERVIRIRRAASRGEVSTPKSGKGRVIGISPGLQIALEALLMARRREALEHRWQEVPPWVFCSSEGTMLDEGNLTRLWHRLRRRAQATGVRPLRLHCARHTWATHALRAGKSIRWVAQQLGHADPALTLRTYSHVLREEETDLRFADFGVADGPARPLTAPALPAALRRGGQPIEIPGAPERTRTSDTRFRKPLLYPSELRGRGSGS
jgi:integrase